MKRIDYPTLYNKFISVIFSVMIVIMIVVLAIGLVDLFVDIWHLALEHKIPSGYLEIIYDVLTLFIIIELLRSLSEYFNCKRIRMTFIADAAIVFVLREIMIKLFEGKIQSEELYGMSALIVSLTILRVGSMLLYQREAKIAK